MEDEDDEGNATLEFGENVKENSGLAELLSRIASASISQGEELLTTSDRLMTKAGINIETLPDGNVSEIYKGLGHDLYVFDFKTRSAYIITCSGKKFVKDVCSSSTSPKEDYRLLFNIAKGTFNPKSGDSYIGYN